MEHIERDLMAIKHHGQPKRIRVTFDECTLVLHMWICIFTYIYTYTTSEVFSTIQTSSTPVCSQTPKYPECMSTISKHFITCPCITHQCTSEYLMPSTHALQHIAKTFAHLQMHILIYPKHSRHTVLHLQTPSWTKSHIDQISSIIYTCHAEYLENLPKHLDINSFDFSAFLTHWYTSLNISVVQGHAPMLSLVFILTHQFGIFHPLLLKFSFALGSIVKHNYSPSPFSESTPGSPSTIPFSFTFYLFLLSHFPPFILISFFVFNVLDLYISFIASEASNPSLKRKSPKQTRTNSVFAKIRKDGFDWRTQAFQVYFVP